jgi:Tol biopolymer transport system component
LPRCDSPPPECRDASEPVYSPDGRTIYYGGAWGREADDWIEHSDLFRIPARGGKPVRLTHLSAKGYQVDVNKPNISPDGKRLVFVRSAGTRNRSGLWIIGANGRGARRLTSGAIDIQPSWSRSGRIVFVRIDPRTFQSGIWLVRPNGRGLRRLRTRLRNATRPVWSPAGTQLLLTDGKVLMIVNADGSKRRTITKLAADARGNLVDPEPAWSADGRQVVFTEARARTTGRADLWIVNADGTGRRRLTASPGVDSDPHWRG